jgi:hypothetical protein
MQQREILALAEKLRERLDAFFAALMSTICEPIARCCCESRRTRRRQRCQSSSLPVARARAPATSIRAMPSASASRTRVSVSVSHGNAGNAARSVASSARFRARPGSEASSRRALSTRAVAAVRRARRRTGIASGVLHLSISRSSVSTSACASRIFESFTLTRRTSRSISAAPGPSTAAPSASVARVRLSDLRAWCTPS